MVLRIRCGEFEIDEARFELRRAGEPIAVQPKVLDLIVFLARHRRRVVTKDELFATVWKGTIVTEASLSQAVSLARRALGDDPSTQHTIRTVRSKGFQFVGGCSELSEAALVRPAEAPPGVAPATRPARASTMMETAQEEAPLASTPVRAPHLFAVIHCEAPELGGASWSLAEIDEVRLVRGSTRRTERETGPLTQALTITLPGRLLSRQHARLTRTPSGWVIVDEGSRNGTFVNGERITKRSLSVGDVIECGRTLLYFADAWIPPSRSADVDASILPTVTPSLEALARDLERIASLALPVLLVGEAGTGKTFTAHALHARAERSGALVTVDAATVAAETSLLEVAAEQAHGGTLVIDNLQRAEATGLARLAGVIERATAVRFVATRGGIAGEVDRVPADLLGRLSGFRCELPPLRERLGDLGVLVASLSRSLGLHLPELDPSVARAFFAHCWPGNLRELTQTLEVCVALSRGATVRLQHLPPDLRASAS